MQPQQETPGLNLKSGRKKVISMFYTKKPALFQAFISMFQTLNGVGEGGGGSSLENNQEKKNLISGVIHVWKVWEWLPGYDDAYCIRL